MTEELKSKHNLDRYIQQAFFVKLNRVFGVVPYFALRSDHSDARQMIANPDSSRAVTRCFVRPTDFNIRKDGFRHTATAGRGMRAGVSATAGGEPSEVRVLHPSPIDTTWEVVFEVSSWDQVMDLYSIWAASIANSSMQYQVEYDGVPFTINVRLEDNLAMPDGFGSAEGDTRSDVAEIKGTMTVEGYTLFVSDPHRVPIILTHDFVQSLKPTGV